MDSLLASYGSESEDADSPPGSPKPVVETFAGPAPSGSLQSTSGSLPQRRNSAPKPSIWDEMDEPLKPWSKNSGSSAAASSLLDDEDGPLKPLNRNCRIAAPDPSLWNDEDEPLKSLKRNSAVHSGGDSERTTRATSFFTSLPPPKSTALEKNTDWGEPLKRNRFFELANNDPVEETRGGSPFSSPPSPRLEYSPLPPSFFNGSTNVSRADIPSHEDNIPGVFTGKSSSLFARLPPPASSKSLFEKLPLPVNSKTSAVPRQLVEFKPLFNLALVETTEEDDSERSMKRSKPSKDSEDAMELTGEGLVALLPPPKNSLGAGAALGGGGVHGGRRTVMETASDSDKMGKEVNSRSGLVPRKGDSRSLEAAEGSVEHPDMRISNNGYGNEPSGLSNEGSYAQSDGRHHNLQLWNPREPHAHDQFGSSDGYLEGNAEDERSWENPEANRWEAEIQPTQGQVLAEVIKKERRRGVGGPPPEMIEIRQADLTGGSKLREDQLHATGIAFGPSYKPGASTKDKPSKLHRRKHQIGALYFDMKQNEMNLLDRRSKGSLTKAETQAKYGW